MVAKDYPREFAERCFKQIEGFGEYGFPESHAASFALLVYASSWLKCHYPDVFAAALLNAQPMGFYAPAQIVRDAREHGVEVRAVDVNHSALEATLESSRPAAGHLHEVHRDMTQDILTCHAIRLGLKEIQGFSEEDAIAVVTQRGRGYDSVRDLWLRTSLSPRVIERLADADAFSSLGLSRRHALWAAKALGRAGDQDERPLFRGQRTDDRGQMEAFVDPSSFRRQTTDDGGQTEAFGNLSSAVCPPSSEIRLPPMPPGEEVVNDYRFLKLSLRAHPASFLRADLIRRGVICNDELRRLRSGTRVTVSGLITVRQRPGSANGVIFMSIEDETALANVIVWPKLFERCRPVVLGARYVAVTGRMQEESSVIHVVADRLEDLTSLLGRLSEAGPAIDGLARCDEVRRPSMDHREKRALAPPKAALARLMDETPELAADLDVPARATRHVIPKGRRRAGG
jgi:error-prone DNA polymerase